MGFVLSFIIIILHIQFLQDIKKYDKLVLQLK